MNETAGRQFWQSANPIDKHLSFYLAGRPIVWRRVVGVVRDVRETSLEKGAVPEIYLPLDQHTGFAAFIVLRSTAPLTALAEELRRATAQIDSRQAVFFSADLQSFVNDSLEKRRVALLVTGFFAISSLILASLGVYGMFSYSVVQRTLEIGIRIAVGATAKDVAYMLFREFTAIVAAGLLVGVGALFALSRWLSSFLFGIGPTNPAVVHSTSLLLSLVAFFAILVPMRRAMTVDPVQVLTRE